MEKMTLFLANSDLLIRNEEGQYSIEREGQEKPHLIEREEGERILFDTANQLIQVVSLLSGDQS